MQLAIVVLNEDGSHRVLAAKDVTSLITSTKEVVVEMGAWTPEVVGVEVTLTAHFAPTGGEFFREYVGDAVSGHVAARVVAEALRALP